MAARVKELWRISVGTSPEAEDAVTELVTRTVGSPASVYADAETGETTVSAFASKMTDAQRVELRVALKQLRELGVETAPARISLSRIKRENWAESWKRHFKPLEISARLLIKPSWSKRKPKRGQAVVVLDPGLSFGTGQHPTTSFCLEQLARLRRTGISQSLLDVGCGSGILAIAATKLGYAPVEAFDFDPEAVRVARENALANKAHPLIARRDLTKLPQRGKQFDVVCANLIYDLLIAERDKLLSRVKADGTLVLAGILNEQFAAVKRSFVDAGMKSVGERSVGEWRSGAFVRR